MNDTALYSLAEIREMERVAQAGLPAGPVVPGPPAAAAELALHLMEAGTQRVLLLAGPGNNGGDALDMAARLAGHCEVIVVLFADAAKLPEDAAQALLRAQQSRVRFFDRAQAPALLGQAWALIVDGLFGIGLSRPITGELRAIVEAVNRQPKPVLALDIPSGLDADTGNVVGPDGIAVEASHTITFIGNKPGLHTGDGRDHAGSVTLADLQITDAQQPQLALSGPVLFQHACKPRRHNSHKGSYGDVAIVGGAEGMTGATLLAARAAAKCGAGRTLAVFAGPAPALDPAQPELMCRSADGFQFGTATLVVGPGLGQSPQASVLLQQALENPTPLVLDADALNLLAANKSLQHELAARSKPAILTPHPLEAARLLGTDTREVQADRVHAARTLARLLQAVVVLKGSGSVIASPDGHAAINPNGNPGLATAGSGDILAGVCGALLAQGIAPWEAALAAVWLHGGAADLLLAQGVGPIGLTAGELIEPIRTLLNQLAYRTFRQPG